MEFATLIFLGMLVFHNYFYPDSPAVPTEIGILEINDTDSTTTLIIPELEETTTTFTAIHPTRPPLTWIWEYPTIEPLKPIYNMSGLITGTGSGNAGGGGYACGTSCVTENPELTTTTDSNNLGYVSQTTLNPNGPDGEFQIDNYYKRWDCLWAESHCERVTALRYCSHGCLARYSTGKSKCFDGCCRCLISTTESPAIDNQQYYEF